MAFKTVKAGVRNGGNLIQQATDMINQNAFKGISLDQTREEAMQALGGVTGAEAFSAFTSGFKETSQHGSLTAALAAMGRNDHYDQVQSQLNAKVEADIRKTTGLESFTLAQFKGQALETKAVNIVLNSQTRLQTKAADELFKTLTVRYEDEGVRITVRAAGVGSYVSNAVAWESMTELTPIFGILRTGDIFKDDLLRVVPVFPEDANDPNRRYFAEASVSTPTPHEYPGNDAYGRTDHLTQRLAVPGSVENLLGLCTAPGQRGWTDTDDIESSSIRITELGITGKLLGADVQFFIPTDGMTNTSLTTTSIGQNSNDRDRDITIRHHSINTILDDEGNSAVDLFKAAFDDKGYVPNLFVKMGVRYNRQGYRLDLTTGSVYVESMTRKSDGVRVTLSTATDEEKALMSTATFRGTVNTATPVMNLTNASNGNFGYRLEVFDTQKELTTRRQDPVSVKYPVRKEDVNKEALDDTVSYMGVTIQTNCSKHAFERAYEHLDYLQSIDGAPVVDNENGGNDLPGRMYCSVAAVRRSLRIQDSISSVNNMDVFDNVCSLLLTEIQDITAALAFKSGIAAINEYAGIARTKWSIIVHQNLARFLMRSGDARITANEDFNIVESNFDSMIGKILIVPQNDSTEDRINPLGGVGVNVAKENVVLHGQVTRGSQDFGVMMNMPCYMHWALNVIMGELVITDAEDFLGNDGVFHRLAGVNVRTAPGQTVETSGNGGTTPPTGPTEVLIVNDAANPVIVDNQGN